MRHFLFEDRYHYRPNFKRSKAIRDPAVELIRLLRMGSGKTGARAPRKLRDLRQKCIPKMQYSKSIEAHNVQLKKYLVREGAGLNGEDPKLFGTDTKEYEENMVGKNIRIFLSPESKEIDVKELAVKFMEKLEKQTGHHFYWQGACHYNTAHPHAHLLINGVDKQGNDVWIPRDIVKTFMRETARNLCTKQIGLRTQADLDREKEQELYVPRNTKLDNRINDLCVGSRVSLSDSDYDIKRILLRLETLRKLKLCRYENGNYIMHPNWQTDLQTNAKYNVFLKAREKLQYSSLMKQYTGSDGLVTGKVTKIYRTDDDASDNHVVILESIDGKAYFIPLLKQPELHDSGKKSLLKEGELVSIKTYETQKGRLTPIIFKQNITSTQNAIKKNNYTGNLAAELIKSKSGGWRGTQTN